MVRVLRRRCIISASTNGDKRAHRFTPIGFEKFIQDHSGSLQRIARDTPDRMSRHDLQNEAYVAACEIGEKRGVALDLRDEGERQCMLGRLYNRFVKFVRGRWRDARLDHAPHPHDEHGLASRLCDYLQAPSTCEPLTQLLEAEDERMQREAARPVDYSELLAYSSLLSRFESSVKQLAMHLAVTARTLRKRIQRASNRTGVQMALFRGDNIDERFLTRPEWLRQLCPRWSGQRRRLARGGAQQQLDLFFP